jgi:hypothetical protein
MGAPEMEVQEPAGQTQAIESARAAQVAALAEANNLIETLKAKLAEANAKLGEINEAASAVIAAKTQITDHQTVVATKSAHIQDAQTHADKVRAELDRIQTAATQQATEAEGLRARAQSAVDNIAPVVAAITANKAATQSDLAATNAAREEAKAAAIATKALADKAATVEERVTDYEGKLAKLEEDGNAKLATITGLLPGATAAGLAHAFDARRKTFLPVATSGERWFVGSILALVILAATGLWSGEKHDTLPDLARLWLLRAPIAAALIWLALHSSRNAALAKRLEEDYGFKAATAAQFQGFQTQMAEIGTAAPDSPLAKLYTDTLAIIANPPGRIYEKHKLTVSPGAEIAAAAAAAREAVSPAGKEEEK